MTMSEHQLGDAPIEDRYREQMYAMMQTFDEFMNPDIKNRKVGIVVLMFPFGDESGRCNYISNGADRKDIVTMMKEQIARFEGQPEVRGRA